MDSLFKISDSPCGLDLPEGYTACLAGPLRNQYWQVKGPDGFAKYAHIIVAEMAGIYVPGMFVDHINMNQLDNRPENLRMVSAEQNARNHAGWSNREHALPKNVFKARDKFRVMIRIAGKLKSFGSFKDLELADLVANEARSKYHGEFAFKSI